MSKEKGKVIGMGGKPQQPPKAQMQLDPTKLPTVECNCGSIFFEEVTMLQFLQFNHLQVKSMLLIPWVRCTEYVKFTKFLPKELLP